MENIEMRICKCGRIHFYSTEVLNDILEEDKELVLICSHCGQVTHVGANKEPMCFYDETADEDEICFNMYSWNEEKGEITSERFDSEEMNKQGKATIGKVIIDEGVAVMMETGYNANGYQNGKFYDNWYPDFLFNYTEMYSNDIKSLITEWKHKRESVCMPMLIRQLTDEQAKLLSECPIEGLDWSGTKWANEWNCKTIKA